MKVVKSAWKQWLKFAHIVGNFQGQVLMTLFYFVLVAPIGISTRIASDPLRMRPIKGRTNFQKWTYKANTLEAAGKQY